MRGLTAKQKKNWDRLTSAPQTDAVPKWKAGACKSCGTPNSVINGAWLSAERKAAGITLREMSRRLGFSAPYLCDVEWDRRNCTPKIRAAYEALRGEA